MRVFAGWVTWGNETLISRLKALTSFPTGLHGKLEILCGVIARKSSIFHIIEDLHFVKML